MFQTKNSMNVFVDFFLDSRSFFSRPASKILVTYSKWTHVLNSNISFHYFEYFIQCIKYTLYILRMASYCFFIRRELLRNLLRIGIFSLLFLAWLCTISIKKITAKCTLRNIYRKKWKKAAKPYWCLPFFCEIAHTFHFRFIWIFDRTNEFGPIVVMWEMRYFPNSFEAFGQQIAKPKEQSCKTSFILTKTTTSLRIEKISVHTYVTA